MRFVVEGQRHKLEPDLAAGGVVLGVLVQDLVVELFWEEGPQSVLGGRKELLDVGYDVVVVTLAEEHPVE